MLALWLGVFACGGDSAETEPICNPGDFVFCRCEAGQEGQKQCNEQGNGFAECRLGPNLACPSELATSSASSGAGGDGGASASSSAVTTTSSSSISSNASTSGSGGAAPGLPWINELHYDNNGADVDEGIEVAGPAGTDLFGWSVVLYSGSDGLSYDTVPLDGVIPDEENGVGAIWFPKSGMQNGSPDGLALVDPFDDVVLFLSYEGGFSGQDGPAIGLGSVDIVASEPDTTIIGLSLQLTGTGQAYADFVWQPPSLASRGLLNPGQTIP